MDYQLQVVTLSVSDVDKATEFYTKQAGFTLDVDYRPASGFRVVQLTPPGSACSVQIGTGLTDAPPGSARATCLVVTDIEAARRELTDYASFADFADPDGNTWVIQQIGHRPSHDVADIILDAARDVAVTP
jgi:catechol 2,3-dioxygenase-like lactoylglutathione lyase family enzyme